MDTSRLRPGELLAAAGGVLLLVALVLDWYAVEGGGRSLNGWQAFGVIDVVLALLALGGLALAALNLLARGVILPVAAEVLVTAFGLLALLLVLYRLVNQPGANSAVGVEPGAYVGLLATAL